MSASQRRWIQIVIGVVALLALIGLGATGYLVKKEGWDGLWKRKRQWVEANHPGASPALDEAEKRLR